LVDDGIDIAGLFRHVLVHTAGVIDDHYVSDAKMIPGAPGLKLNSKLHLDGARVKQIADHVIGKGCELAIGVDKWILSVRRK
jgi:hypothetical protein